MDAPHLTGACHQLPSTPRCVVELVLCAILCPTPHWTDGLWPPGFTKGLDLYKDFALMLTRTTSQALQGTPYHARKRGERCWRLDPVQEQWHKCPPLPTKGWASWRRRLTAYNAWKTIECNQQWLLTTGSHNGASQRALRLVPGVRCVLRAYSPKGISCQPDRCLR